MKQRTHQGQRPLQIWTDLGADSAFPIRQRMRTLAQSNGIPQEKVIPTDIGIDKNFPLTLGLKKKHFNLELKVKIKIMQTQLMKREIFDHIKFSKIFKLLFGQVDLQHF